MSKENLSVEEFVKLVEEQTEAEFALIRNERVLCPCCGKKLQFKRATIENLARAKKGYCVKCFKNSVKWDKINSKL